MIAIVVYTWTQEPKSLRPVAQPESPTLERNALYNDVYSPDKVMIDSRG